MGYYAQVFAVDLEKIKQVIGSNDLSLLEKIKSSDLYETYESQSEDVDFENLVKELLFNNPNSYNRKETSKFFGLFKSKPTFGLNPKYAPEYGYAMLVICDALGFFQPDCAEVLYTGDIWKETNKLFKNKGINIDLDRMWQTENLFDIPEINDFPVISHYSKNDIDYLLLELKKNNLEIETKNNPDLKEFITTFREGLQFCKDKNLEWISFIH